MFMCDNKRWKIEMAPDERDDVFIDTKKNVAYDKYYISGVVLKEYEKVCTQAIKHLVYLVSKNKELNDELNKLESALCPGKYLQGSFEYVWESGGVEFHLKNHIEQERSGNLGMLDTLNEYDEYLDSVHSIQYDLELKNRELEDTITRLNHEHYNYTPTKTIAVTGSELKVRDMTLNCEMEFDIKK